jgi:DNA-binding SARP family transcriptional activator
MPVGEPGGVFVVQFHGLGPLLIRDNGGHEVAVHAHLDRVLLATLMLNASRVVPLHQLVDAMWGAEPPSTARSQVHKCVSRLRRLIPAEMLHTDPAGYLLRVDPGELDFSRFEELVSQARADAAAGHTQQASAEFRDALALWRGPAFAGVESDAVRDGTVRLQEQRWQAWEDYVDVELSLGHASALVGELATHIREHPTRERPRAQLMLALYRSGRQADALAVFRQANQEFTEELGVTPGAELIDLHQRILRGDPSLQRAVRALAETPRNLPRDIPDFTGREDILRRLIESIPDDPDGTSLIHAIDGMPGIGKTSLAVHLAHMSADRYPDAQLFIDLRGHSRHSPTDPGAALDALLRQLGVPEARIPHCPDARGARWRSELAGRRVLLVLDNAASSEQVAPLLPGGPDCMTVITSRRRLAGLDGARPISLEVLTEDEAIKLQHRIVGDRVTADRAAATEVARQCGHLPLAIRLAAARLAHRPTWALSDLVSRLGQARFALDEIAVEGRSVSDAFALSYQHMDEMARRVFQLLAWHPGVEFDGWSVARLADIEVHAAATVVERLVDANLVQEPRAGRYRLHDLMRDYAHRISDDQAPQARRTATARVLDYYLYNTAAAGAHLEVSPFDFGPAPSDCPVHDFDSSGATDWLSAERANIVAGIRLAAQTDLPEHVWRLARALWVFLYRFGYTDDLRETQEIALSVAERVGDESAIASAHNYLASGYLRLGQVAETARHVRFALTHARVAGDARLEAIVLGNSATVQKVRCRFVEAIDDARRSLAVHAAAGSQLSAIAGNCHVTMGEALSALGRYEEALVHQEACLEIARRLDRRYLGAVALGQIGLVQLRLGRLAQAEVSLTESADRQQDTGSIGEAEAVNSLAVLRRLRGEHAAALSLHEGALAILSDRREPFAEALIRNAYGRTLRLDGRLGVARDQHRAALTTAVDSGNVLEEGRALAGLADIDEFSDRSAARAGWARALAIYTELGVPDRHEIADRLARTAETNRPVLDGVGSPG